MTRRQALVSLSILLCFLVADWMQELLRLAPAYRSLYDRYPFWVPESLKSALQIALVVIFVMAFRRAGLGKAGGELGIARSPVAGLSFGLVATLPLWIAFGVTAPLVRSTPAAEALYLALFSPLAEELVYRGFAFGCLRRLAGWGFWPAALLTALVFGWGHVEKSQSVLEAAGLMALTGVGASVFAWLYERWGFDLWVPLSLHVLMNLGWQVFAVGETALAGWFPTAVQLAVVVAAIVLTLVRRRVPLWSGAGRAPA